MEPLVELAEKKRGGLIQLALVGCKSRVSTMAPLLRELNQGENKLQSLLIPRQNLGDDGFEVICDMLRNSNQLRNLDISWNKTLAKQNDLLFKSLSKNRALQYLNISMLAIDPKQNLKGLKMFIRRNKRLLHLNLNGIFKEVQQVK